MPDSSATIAAFADEETVDTDFIHHLVRGAELLQSGDAAQARSTLERALRLRPKNQRGQNLLALSYFKLGQYDQAEQVYKALIDDYPQDPVLRLNLGLVHLKTRRIEEAVLAFNTVLSLDPNHTKAQSYLGLAHMQQRDYERAREWFVRAGNTVMADRMALLVREKPLHQVGEGGLQALDAAEVPFTPALETTPGQEAGPWTALQPGAVASLTPALPEPTSAESTAAETTAPHHAIASAIGPFAVTKELVSVDVKSEIFLRLAGLTAVFGQIDFRPAFKRFRGRVTEKPFGDAVRRMMHVNGKGRLWMTPGTQTLTPIEIGDEPAYFREESVFGFEESLLFENGRVPSKVGSDLQLVHLRNRGRALIASKHPPRSMSVQRGEPCQVLVDVLIGWQGDITPRIVTLGGDALPEGVSLVGVELTGEGRVLLDAPV
jgi:hypothetical protein